MSSKSQKQAYTEYSPDVCEDAPARSTGPSNSDVLAKLSGAGAGATPPVDLGEATSGNTFAAAAATALEACVPGPGSFASMKLVGKIPFYSIAAARAFFEPALHLQAARTNANKLEVTMAVQAGVRADAGVAGIPWWPELVMYLKAYVKGSIKIVADSAREVFQEFLLLLAELTTFAARQVAEITEPEQFANGLLDGNYAAFASAMGAGESIAASVGGGVEGGVRSPVADGAIGAEVMFSRTYQNTDGDDDLEVSETTSLTVTGQLNHAKLGLTVPANVTFVKKEGKLDEWFVGVGMTKKLPLGVVSKEVLLGAAWAEGLVNAMSNLVATTASKAKLDSAAVADLVAGISVGGDALAYTALGDQLKAAANHPDFDGKSGQEVSLAVDGQAGWSVEKGTNVRAGVSTAETWTLGEEGKTPLFIEARSGDSIVSFEAGTKTGTSVGT